MSVGQKIKEIREKKGFNQYQLADKLNNFNQSQISKIEHDKRKLSVEELMGIAKALEVSLEDLINI